MRSVVAALTVGVALVVPPALAQSPKPPVGPPQANAAYWQQQGCTHGHPSKVAYKSVSRIMRSPRPLTKRRGKKTWHYVHCVKTDRKSAAVRRKLVKLREWRRSYEVRWWIKWMRLPYNAKSWTISTSGKEAGRCGIPGQRRSFHKCIARDSGFLSFFQWLMPTWRAACGCGVHPEYGATWHHQVVVAWYWHLSHPSGQWPNTGEG